MLGEKSAKNSVLFKWLNEDDIYIYIYIYMGSIYSWIHISLNNEDIFCLHIFIHILLSQRIDIMVAGGN